MTQINVLEVIHFAQKAVTHPLAPLYDSHQHVRVPFLVLKFFLEVSTVLQTVLCGCVETNIQAE